MTRGKGTKSTNQKDHSTDQNRNKGSNMAASQQEKQGEQINQTVPENNNNYVLPQNAAHQQHYQYFQTNNQHNNQNQTRWQNEHVANYQNQGYPPQPPPTYSNLLSEQTISNGQNGNPVHSNWCHPQANNGQPDNGLLDMMRQIQQTNMSVLSRIASIEANVSKLSTIEQDISLLRSDVTNLKSENKSMCNKILGLEHSCQSMGNIFDQHLESKAKCENDVKTLKTENQRLKHEIDQTNQKYQTCSDDLQELKARSMQENLLFFGINETEQIENKSSEEILRRFLKEEVATETPDSIDSIVFDRVHRLGKKYHNARNPRPIVAKFERYRDRETIRKKGIDLNKERRGFSIREQFPVEMEQKRKQLYPVMRRLQQNPNNRVTLVRDKLYVNGQLYEQQDPNRHSDPYPAAHSSRAYRGDHVRRPPQHTQRRVTSTWLQNRYDSLPVSDGESGNSNTERRGRQKKKATSPIDNTNTKKYRNAEDSSDTDSDMETQNPHQEVTISDSCSTEQNTNSSTSNRANGETSCTEENRQSTSQNDSTENESQSIL